MADVLDKIIVPHQKSKGDVFKKHKKAKEEDHKKEEHKKTTPPHKIYMHEKKDIFNKGEFGSSQKKKEIIIRFSINPQWTERSIFIIIILILAYFAFFKNIDLNLTDSLKFSEEIDSLETSTIQTAAIVNESNDTEEETTETVNETEEIVYSETVKFTIDDITKEDYATGYKVTKFKYTIENDKSKNIGVKLLYYAYGGNRPIRYEYTAENNDNPITYSILTPGQKITKEESFKIIFSQTSNTKMRFELTDKSTGETYHNITKTI